MSALNTSPSVSDLYSIVGKGSSVRLFREQEVRAAGVARVLSGAAESGILNDDNLPEVLAWLSGWVIFGDKYDPDFDPKN